MITKCEKCNDFFEVPDGQKFTSAHCPFCDHNNELKKHSITTPAVNLSSPPTLRADKQPRHPLSIPMWIAATCLTVIACILIFEMLSGIFVTFQMAEQEKIALKEIDALGKEFEKESTEMINGVKKKVDDVVKQMTN